MRESLGNCPRAWIFLAGLIMLVAPDIARTQPYEAPETWGGDIWSRPRLTGDWGGLRDDLAKMGVVFDVDLQSFAWLAERTMDTPWVPRDPRPIAGPAL